MELVPGLDRIYMGGRRTPRQALDAALRRLSMGEIRVQLKLENLADVYLRGMSKRKRRKIRTVTLDAIADTGAVHTLVPEEAAGALGLKASRSLTVVLANDQKISLPMAPGVRLTVAGREMTTDVLIGPPGCAALVGQLVMEALDLIADPAQRTLTVRPESPLRPTVAMRALTPLTPPGFLVQ